VLSALQPLSKAASPPLYFLFFVCFSTTAFLFLFFLRAVSGCMFLRDVCAQVFPAHPQCDS
jgi:hypothetical protein